MYNENIKRFRIEIERETKNGRTMTYCREALAENESQAAEYARMLEVQDYRVHGCPFEIKDVYPIKL